MTGDNLGTVVSAWVESLPGDYSSDDLRRAWIDFSETSRPVVTLYGSYDTGKSAILRRLLIEDGSEVPEWLTISARHETFEVGTARAAGCAIQDTPGIVVGPSDLRADVNTALAQESVRLTDIALIVVTPQLPTAERDALKSLAAQRWEAGGLWFVISRFDEAGVDPDGDVEGYRSLAQRKTQELRTSIGLDERVPVFVVTADYAGAAGGERSPDPSIWDETRPWDGMAELLGALQSQGAEGISHLRSDSAERFWLGVVSDMTTQLQEQLVDYRGNLATAREAVSRRESWMQQLDTLRDAARASLEGEIDDSIRSVLQRQVFGAADLNDVVVSRLDAWAAQQNRQLDSLAQNVQEGIQRQRSRPSWESLEGLLSGLKPSDTGDTRSQTDGEGLTWAPRIGTLANSLKDALNSYVEVSGKRLSDFTSRPSAADQAKVAAQKAGRRAERVAEVVAAATPVVLQTAQVVEEILQDNARSRERQQAREALDREATALARSLATLAFEEWDAGCTDLAQAIDSATADEVVLVPGLERLIREIEEAQLAGSVIVRSASNGGEDE